MDLQVAASELLREGSGGVLVAVGRLEDALSQAGVYERVMHRVKRLELERVGIIDYKPQFKRYFRSLSLEWLQEYYSVEDANERLFSAPHGQIIKAGGIDLFARLDGKIVGIAALLRRDQGIYELTKMVVTREAEGRQVGRKLALAVIEQAKNAPGGCFCLPAHD